MSLALPVRPGPRPRTHYGLPHEQLDQNPSPPLYRRLVERFLAVPDTTHGQSLISVPGAQALFLHADCSCNAPTRFMRGREFAHVHPPRDGSFHMVLSPEDSRHVVAQRWGELHPWTVEAKVPASIVLVYAPRDDDEIDIALAIADASRAHAQGQQGEGG